MEKQKPLDIAGENVKWCGHCAEVWWFLKKLIIELPYNPPILLLCVYPGEIKTYVHTDICTWMFIAAIIIAKRWKLKNPTRWTDNKLCRHIWNTLSHNKGQDTDTGSDLDEHQKHDAKWKKPDTKVTQWMIPFTWYVRNRQIHRRQLQITREWEKGGMGTDH